MNSFTISYDIIARILEFCGQDYALLFHCSLVNWQFNFAASKMLYSTVVISPKFDPVATLNLRDIGALPTNSNFTSACLPRNAPNVHILEISGCISPRPPPRNTLSEKIAAALSAFDNLTSVKFTPTTYHEALFEKSIPLLHKLTYLTELSVNSSCTDDPHASAIVQITGLRKLTVFSPGRTILNLLPEWLAKLSSSLVELHLQDNCGSVTPGVLTTILPHLEERLEAFTLGLSYSLTNDDVFTFLGQLKCLKTLQLRYYWQLRHALHQPRLASLRSLFITYTAMYTRREVNDFDKWVRWMISRSPGLQALHLQCEDESTVYISHDSLVDHLVKKHTKTLRVLDFSTAFIGLKSFECLLSTCARLEVVSVQSGKGALDLLVKHIPKLSCLRSVSFQICNARRAYEVDPSLIGELLRKGHHILQRCVVDNVPWEAAWTTDTENQTSLIICKVEDPIPPWARQST